MQPFPASVYSGDITGYDRVRRTIRIHEASLFRPNAAPDLAETVSQEGHPKRVSNATGQPGCAVIRAETTGFILNAGNGK